MTKKKHRPRVSGDPRKRVPVGGTPLHPGRTVAYPFTHACGCRLAWSCKHDPSESKESVAVRLEMWLRTIAHMPCPMHGSASGVPEPPLMPGVVKIMAQQDGNVAYTLCPEDRYAFADGEGERLRRLSDPRRQRALSSLWKVSPEQAAASSHIQLSRELGDEACFICGDVEGTDWYRWTDDTREGLLCPDCVEIQHDMYSTGSGDHLVKVVRK